MPYPALRDIVRHIILLRKQVQFLEIPSGSITARSAFQKESSPDFAMSSSHSDYATTYYVGLAEGFQYKTDLSVQKSKGHTRFYVLCILTVNEYTI